MYPASPPPIPVDLGSHAPRPSPGPGSIAGRLADGPEEFELLLDRQGGAATTAQLSALLSRRDLGRLVRTGRLSQVWHGVYTRPDPSVAVRMAAADVAAGTPVAACLGTAAAIHGFDTEGEPDLHVLNPARHQLRHARGLLVHRRDGAPLCLVDGRAVTTAAWTAVEVARGLRRPRALATLDAALRSGSCTPTGLWTAARRQAGRRGIVVVRELLPLSDGRAASPMESEARLVMLDGGLPRPVLQYEVCDGRMRFWRNDFAWPENGVVAEYDGEMWHGADAMRRDRMRYNALRDAGWTVIPIIAEDVRRSPGELVYRIRRELERAAA